MVAVWPSTARAIPLGTFTFDNDRFGNTLVESDGGTLRSQNWLNVVDAACFGPLRRRPRRKHSSPPYSSPRGPIGASRTRRLSVMVLYPGGATMTQEVLHDGRRSADPATTKQ